LINQISPGKKSKKIPTATKTTEGFCQELLDKSKLRRRKKTKIQQ
jgi:predicted nucleic acid-binding Zn ribbon protein